jgi:ABC-type glycerol-3-phosphate transport system substrate-binding protein
VNKLTKLAFLGLALATALGLSACGGPGAPSSIENQSRVPGTTTIIAGSGPNQTRGYQNDTVRTLDGKTVSCLRYYDGGSSSSVISCDWENAK